MVHRRNAQHSKTKMVSKCQILSDGKARGGEKAQRTLST